MIAKACKPGLTRFPPCSPFSFAVSSLPRLTVLWQAAPLIACPHFPCDADRHGWGALNDGHTGGLHKSTLGTVSEEPMSIPSEKTSAIKSESDVDMEKFDLDKTYAAWYESHKQFATSLNMLFAFTGMLAVAVFVDAPEGGFKIPIVGVSLQKWKAVELLSIIHLVSYLRFVAVGKYNNLLNVQFTNVLTRVGGSGKSWHWRRPTMISFLVYSRYRKGYTLVGYVLVIFIAFGGGGLPIYCLMKAYNEVGLTVDLSIAIGVCGVLFIIATYIVRSKDADESSLQRLDSTEG